jgi:hypothetical protein
MFRVAYATAHDQKRFTDVFATLDEARRKACELLVEHGTSMVLDIRMGETMVLIGDHEIRAWCAERASRQTPASGPGPP